MRPEAPVSARVDPVVDPADGSVPEREVLSVPVSVSVPEPEPEPVLEPEPELEPALEPVPEPIRSAVIVCTACGTPAEPDDRFCASCGQHLPRDGAAVAAAASAGERFVLQFSTGESYTVIGSGLAGRNPRPEPGEVVDHLVTIVDPGRSVSKTHLEFGQSDGMFWVSDRHSGNGTVIREPGAEPRTCVPGRRYPIVRGTQVDLGDQHLLLS